MCLITKTFPIFYGYNINADMTLEKRVIKITFLISPLKYAVSTHNICFCGEIRFFFFFFLVKENGLSRNMAKKYTIYTDVSL